MSWRDFAGCRDVPTEVFFDHTDEGVKAAKKICGVCPVRRECLDARLAELDVNDLDFGVWGGMTPAERSREAYERTLRRK
jgi:WhiB family redox-sensing transcriptional regulator